MGEAITIDEFRNFCNSHIQYAVDEGEAEIRSLPNGSQAIHYETPSGVKISWIDGSVVEVSFLQEADHADTETTVDFMVVPPQVNEVKTTKKARRSRTLKAEELNDRLAELGKYIGIIPMLDHETLSEVMPEADVAISRLLSR